MPMVPAEPHTAGWISGLISKFFGLIPKAAAFFQTWWMNVRIISPRDQGVVEVSDVKAGSDVKVEGTYRTTLGKKIVLFKCIDNDYWLQRDPVMGAGCRWTGTAHITNRDQPIARNMCHFARY
jgi:hypothetical protein